MNHQRLRFLLLQIRNADDPMRPQEVRCFARALQADLGRFCTIDLLNTVPTQKDLDKADMVLLGGSGHYSAAGEGPWLDRVLDALREIHGQAKPTFASCWGFQAFSRAMGGRVVNDISRAELGTQALRATEEARRDPVFGHLGEEFFGQMGHEDCVDELPPGTTRLAASEKVRNQAFRFDGLPIYCTQFHPELNGEDLIARATNYPEYIERIAGETLEQFTARCRDTPETEALLRRFASEFLGVTSYD